MDWGTAYRPVTDWNNRNCCITGIFGGSCSGGRGCLDLSDETVEKERKITKPEEELRIGQKVNAKIIDMDLENKRIELSIRELENTSNEYKE